MALPEAKVGLLPCAGGTQRLAWLVGRGLGEARHIVWRTSGCGTAERIGLVEEVVGKGRVSGARPEAGRTGGTAKPHFGAHVKTLIHSAATQRLAKACKESVIFS